MQSKLKHALTLLLFGALFGLFAGIYVTKKLSHRYSTLPQIEVCFTPGEDCTQFVVDKVALAEKELLIQAYNYTSPPILEAIDRAKARRVDVRVILDKSNEQDRYSGGTCMVDHGVPVVTDHSVAIAHNKVMVIDQKHVVTGSFNFTVSAQKRNAENVTFIRNDPQVAARFAQNWHHRHQESREFKRPNNQCTLEE